MSAQPPFDLQHQIEKLERRTLDSYQPPMTPIWGQLDLTVFRRVTALARFWEENETIGYEQYLEDLITAFYGKQVALAFLVVGSKTHIQVYVGAQNNVLDAMSLGQLLDSALIGSFHGIELQPADSKIGTQLSKEGVFKFLGRMSGIPALKSAPTEDRPSEGQTQQIERLLRALRGEAWGYFVFARPADLNSIHHLAQQHLEYLRMAGSLVKRTAQLGGGIQGEYTDRQAQFCVELLEQNWERMQRGKAQGMWQTETYFFAADALTLGKAQTLLRAIYTDRDSTLDPIRTFQCATAGSGQPQGDPLITLLNSCELATCMHLPREEFSGYAIRDYVQFDVALKESAASLNEPTIAVGKIVERGVETTTPYAIRRGDLAKHGLIAGVTGSGKTNTIFHLLSRIWDSGKGLPFLVIEPAKAEYRQLRLIQSMNALRIYTLGDERVAPFRLNPFEFEIAGDSERMHVQTHIDYLKSVFNASFVLYAPMPYVLEQCLHQVYQDKGWDLTTGVNRRVPPNSVGKETNWNIFPTLTDLGHKVDEVTDQLGYEDRIKMDVKAGLKARIESLRLGGKGLMLDTPRSISVGELLAHPTVLELERIGDDEEKAFVMGLLMTRLYEFRVVQAKRASVAGVQHVTVIEEAHRLLKNVPTEVSTESANVKGKSVETFANMLSEIRAYGEGVLIAEQIPTKLAPDAIKNTNLKILHRIVAQDDREVIGATMNLDEAQLRAVTTFGAGQAAVYAEGDDHPFLVKVYPFKSNMPNNRMTDEAVRVAMAPLCAHAPFDSAIRDAALVVMRHAEFRDTFARYVLSMLIESSAAVSNYREIRQLITRNVRAKNAEEGRHIARCLMLEASARWFEEKGRRYNWLYNIVDTMRQQLAEVATQVVDGFENKTDVLAQIAEGIKPKVEIFRNGYISQCQKTPTPFIGCVECKSKCLYQFDVQLLVREPGLRREFTDSIQNSKSDMEMWNRLATTSLDAGKRLIATSDGKAPYGAAICVATEMAAQLELSRASQGKLVKNVKAVLDAKA